MYGTGSDEFQFVSEEPFIFLLTLAKILLLTLLEDIAHQ
jgi:hypothetical protein